MRLHGRVCHFPGKIAPFGDQVGFGKTLIGIAKNVVVVFFNIVRTLRMNPILLRLHGLFWIEPGWKQLIFNMNQIQRLLGNGLSGGHYAGHVVSDVAHPLNRKGGFIMAHGKDAVFVGRVLADDNRDYTLQGFSAGCVNVLDVSVRIRRMQDLANQHTRQEKIVSVLALSGGLTRRVNEGNAFADDGEVGHLFLHPERSEGSLIITKLACSVLSI